MAEEVQRNRAHRAKQAGVKAARQQRQRKKKTTGEQDDGKRHNPKAFTFSGGVVSVQRRVQRSLDVAAATEKRPVVDKTPPIAPPFNVVVQGPPQVGKSLLIRCLTRHFSQRTLGAICGPVTLVASKRRRLTFVECPNDAAGMLDAAKIADLALVLIDAQFGLEMETFEFIHFMQTHGMPRVIGVLTHLDKLPDRKILKRRRKELKARFWTELYDGAKLFYLSGMRNGKYLKRDVLNLARFISVQKFRPLQWRSAHPYLVALKVASDDAENCPPSQADKGDSAVRTPDTRTCQFYGYVRGAVLRASQRFHIPGAGDFEAAEITKLDDPCPAPEREEDQFQEVFEEEDAPGGDDAQEGGDKTARRKKRRSRALKDKQLCVYAPDCEIGGTRLDDDALYIHLPDTKVGFTPRNQLLQGPAPGSLESKKRSATGSRNATKAAEEEAQGAQTCDEDSSDETQEGDESSGSDQDSKVSDVSTSSEEEEEGEDEGALPPAVKMVRELQASSERIASQLRVQRLQLLSSSTKDLEAKTPFRPQRRSCAEAAPDGDEAQSSDGEAHDADREGEELIGAASSSEEGDDAASQQDSADTDASSLLTSRVSERLQRSALAAASLGAPRSLSARVYAQPDGLPLQRRGRKTAKASRGGARPLFEDSSSDEAQALEEAEEEALSSGRQGRFLFGNLRDFCEDDADDGRYASAGERDAAAVYRALGVDAADAFALENFWTDRVVAAIKARFFITGGWEELEEAKRREAEALRREPVTEEEKVAREVEAKRREEEAEKRGQNAARRALAGAEAAMGGFNIGCFVRVTVRGLPREWVETLDSSKPVLLGGLNAGEEQLTFLQLRLRKHRWSPRVLKSNDPLVFSAGWRRFQSLPLFATEDRSESRVRFLKYTPEHLHCLAYIYAPSLPPATPLLALRDLRAVAHFRVSASGTTLQATPDPNIVKKLKLMGEAKKIFKNTAFIKGMFNSDLEVSRCIGAKVQTVSGIRGQIKKAVGKDGVFRASFEDRILMSDVVLCKAWLRVKPRAFYNPVEDVASWRRLRTQAEIRQALKMPTPFRESQLLPYGAPPPAPRKFNPIRIPKQLALKLPFRSRPKIQEATSRLKRLRGSRLQEEKDLGMPLPSAYERRVAALLQRLQTIRNARTEKRREKQKEKLASRQRADARAEARRHEKQMRERKRRYVKKGKVEAAARKKLRLGSAGGGGSSSRPVDA